MPEPKQPFLRRTSLRRAIPAGAVAVLVVAGTIVVQTNASAAPIDTYRTTGVTTGSVEQRLNLTGSVQPVNQTTQGFAVAGTISSVSVSVGDTVRRGQVLATLDPKPLQSAVTAAQATLAQAKATLESDQSAASTSTTASTTGSTTTTTTPTKAPTKAASTTTTSPRAGSPSGTGSGAGAAQGLARAQKNASSAQRIVTADLGRASAALAQCAAFFPSATPVSTPATTTTTTTPTGTPTGPSDAAVKACLSALATAPTQQQIQRDEQTLTRSQADLAKAVTLRIATAIKSAASVPTSSSGSTSRSGTSQSTASQSTASQSSSQSSGSQASGARTGTTNQSSAARVVSDQAAITDAAATLSGAQADLTAATLKASIAGTVGSVSLVKGTASDGENVVIVGAGPAKVTVNVPLASMAQVHVGQKANVTPHGATGSVVGAITSISLLPSTSTATATATAASRAAAGTGTGQATGTGTASSPTYPVVVRVPQALPALASGARAEVSLLIGIATNVLTVPNSALTPLGNGQALALILKNGVATGALVKTGYAGTLTTQVTSGLTADQQVVLADLSTALPTNTTNGRRFGVGGVPGGLSGAGIGGAGLSGAGLSGAGIGGGGFGGGTGTGRTGFTPGG